MARIALFLILVALSIGNGAQAIAHAPPSRTVMLLHGLGRSPRSMAFLAEQLAEAGYNVCNISYPSRKHTIEVLAADFVLPEIIECVGEDADPIDFVTHSLGGIVVRQLAATDAPIRFGRVVMLAPPNGGSEVVDRLGRWPLFNRINGPAGGQLGTAEDDLPRALGPALFEVGIIAGNRSINPILSTMIKGRNDGRVSIENAKLEGMADFIVVPTSHPFIMQNRKVAEQVGHFLEHGEFSFHMDVAAAIFQTSAAESTQPRSPQAQLHLPDMRRLAPAQRATVHPIAAGASFQKHCASALAVLREGWPNRQCDGPPSVAPGCRVHL